MSDLRSEQLLLSGRRHERIEGCARRSKRRCGALRWVEKHQWQRQDCRRECAKQQEELCRGEWHHRDHGVSRSVGRLPWLNEVW